MVKRMIIKIDEKNVQVAENVLRPAPKVLLKSLMGKQKSYLKNFATVWVSA